MIRFNLKIISPLIICISLLMFAACSNATDQNTEFAIETDARKSDSPSSVKNTEEKKFIQCTEPRPQICTREYNPVCARLEDGSMKTYATGCTACADPKVTGYYPGGTCE